MRLIPCNFLFALALTAIPCVYATEVRQVSDVSPSYICIIADTGLPVFERNADVARAPASMVKMMQMLKENSISAQAAEKLGDELPEGRIVRGILHDEEKPEFTELYDQVIEQAHGPLAPRKRKVRRGWI